MLTPLDYVQSAVPSGGCPTTTTRWQYPNSLQVSSDLEQWSSPTARHRGVLTSQGSTEALLICSGRLSGASVRTEMHGVTCTVKMQTGPTGGDMFNCQPPPQLSPTMPCCKPQDLTEERTERYWYSFDHHPPQLVPR